MANKVVRMDWYGDDLMKAVEDNLPEALFAMGNVVLDAAVPRAPKRRGLLRDSGYVGTKTRSSYGPKIPKKYNDEIEISAATVVVVAFAVFYQHMIEGGTKPHRVPIKRKRRQQKTLRIAGVGYRRSVRHPGTKARPFMGPAVDSTRTSMVEELTKRLGKKLEREMGV